MGGWVKIKPPGIGQQVFVHVSTDQGSTLGLLFWTHGQLRTRKIPFAQPPHGAAASLYVDAAPEVLKQGTEEFGCSR